MKLRFVKVTPKLYWSLLGQIIGTRVSNVDALSTWSKSVSFGTRLVLALRTLQDSRLET